MPRQTKTASSTPIHYPRPSLSFDPQHHNVKVWRQLQERPVDDQHMHMAAYLVDAPLASFGASGTHGTERILDAIERLHWQQCLTNVTHMLGFLFHHLGKPLDPNVCLGTSPRGTKKGLIKTAPNAAENIHHKYIQTLIGFYLQAHQSSSAQTPMTQVRQYKALPPPLEHSAYELAFSKSFGLEKKRNTYSLSYRGYYRTYSQHMHALIEHVSAQADALFDLSGLSADARALLQNPQHLSFLCVSTPLPQAPGAAAFLDAFVQQHPFLLHPEGMSPMSTAVTSAHTAAVHPTSPPTLTQESPQWSDGFMACKDPKDMRQFLIRSGVYLHRWCNHFQSALWRLKDTPLLYPLLYIWHQQAHWHNVPELSQAARVCLQNPHILDQSLPAHYVYPLRLLLSYTQYGGVLGYMTPERAQEPQQVPSFDPLLSFCAARYLNTPVPLEHQCLQHKMMHYYRTHPNTSAQISADQMLLYLQKADTTMLSALSHLHPYPNAHKAHPFDLLDQPITLGRFHPVFSKYAFFSNMSGAPHNALTRSWSGWCDTLHVMAPKQAVHLMAWFSQAQKQLLDQHIDVDEPASPSALRVRKL